MSLYDKFHSDINMNHMYNLICKIIKEDNNGDISMNTEYKDLFIKNSKQIFKDINTEDISELNKVVLERNVKEITQLIESKKFEDRSINDRFNEMMQLRNSPIKTENENDNEDKESNTSNDTSENINPFLNISNLSETSVDLNETSVDLNETSVDEILTKVNQNTNKEENTKEDKEENTKEDKAENIKINNEYKIYSSKRSNIHSSRYNYTYNLKNNNIKSSEINKITKMILPIEDNYIFSMPIIFLKIKEFDINITLELDKILDNENKKFGHYKVIEDHSINISDIEKITIDIRDNTETKYDNIDIAKVNIIELKKDEIYFTCTNIEKNNYNVGDYIKIINNYTRSFKSLVYPLKIKRIEKNILICDFNSKINKKYSDVDMKLLNTSNQNIIYFN